MFGACARARTPFTVVDGFQPLFDSVNMVYMCHLLTVRPLNYRQGFLDYLAFIYSATPEDKDADRLGGKGGQSN